MNNKFKAINYMEVQENTEYPGAIGLEKLSCELELATHIVAQL